MNIVKASLAIFTAASLAASAALVMVITRKSMENQIVPEGGKIVSVSNFLCCTAKSLTLAFLAGIDSSNS